MYSEPSFPSRLFLFLIFSPQNQTYGKLSRQAGRHIVSVLPCAYMEDTQTWTFLYPSGHLFIVVHFLRLLMLLDTFTCLKGASEFLKGRLRNVSRQCLEIILKLNGLLRIFKFCFVFGFFFFFFLVSLRRDICNLRST